ncbi:MAG: hypothetical protein LBF88_02250 [Planctomycetaceae bacterium]|nr:hypothetical protein [Planctomycetaceae bacterium]
MKKLITLSLTTVCLGLFALGCTPKPETPTTPPPTETSATESPAADVEKPAADSDAPKTDDKPVDGTPAN